MTDKHRQPQAFILPDETTPTKTRRKQATSEIIFEPELENAALVTVPQTTAHISPWRFRWLGVLVAALFTLFAMWASLSVVQLVESFFARNAFLGWLTLGVAGIAALAALAMIVREIVGLLRLNQIEHVQENAARAINLDERNSANAVCAELKDIYAGRADVKWGLQQFESHASDILDPRDRIHLADRLLLAPLDESAHRLIARRARRVTLLTTVTPAAALDILFVAAQNLTMLRELATLYGGRPSTLSTVKLARMVASHLAVTGGLALSDNLIQHFVGKGLLGKLSARFGEGAVNGILTSRIGLAAIDVCRPIPKAPATRESLTSILKEVMTFGEKKEVADDKD
jgi:putative membrane protein